MPKSGRPEILSSKDKSLIIRSVVKDPWTTSSDIVNDLRKYGEKIISRQTIGKLLKENDLKSFKAPKKPYITKLTRQKRLNFCEKYKNLDWKNVIFSDECRIICFGSNKPPLVRRPIGQSLNPKYTIPTVKKPFSVMIWGCFRGDEIGPLHIVENSMNGEQYTRILDSKLIRFYRSNENSIFQDDSAPCHRCNLVQRWHEDNGIRQLDWPTNSPDLNPIENLWSFVKRKLAAKRPYNKRTLIEAIVKVWNHEIPKELLLKLSDSMKKRIEDCKSLKGYATKY